MLFEGNFSAGQHVRYRQLFGREGIMIMGSHNGQPRARQAAASLRGDIADMSPYNNFINSPRHRGERWRREHLLLDGENEGIAMGAWPSC